MLTTPVALGSYTTVKFTWSGLQPFWRLTVTSVVALDAFHFIFHREKHLLLQTMAACPHPVHRHDGGLPINVAPPVWPLTVCLLLLESNDGGRIKGERMQ